MPNISLQPAFILFTRAYKDTSMLLELFGEDYGRFSVIARGVKGVKKSTCGSLQPFIPLLISCKGKGELLNLVYYEVLHHMLSLRGNSLYAGFYLNELIMYLLPKYDQHKTLYQYYKTALLSLANGFHQQVLRKFEKQLLEELGYGLLPKISVDKYCIKPDVYYRFVPTVGLQELPITTSVNNYIYLGKNLVSIAEDAWHDQGALLTAKYLFRQVLMFLLNGKKINSRNFFLTGKIC